MFIGRVTFPSKGPMRGAIKIYSKKCTLAQTRMKFSSLTLPIKGSMSGQYVFLIMVKSQSFIEFLFSISVSGDSPSICLK